MATKKTATVKKTKEQKPKTSTAKKRVTTDVLKKRILELEGQLATTQAEYGKLIEQITNQRLKLDAALGQFLKGLYIIDLAPEPVIQKCNQMFRKKIQAD